MQSVTWEAGVYCKHLP